ncbi:MAG TPA: ABC transporter ATP-binding protein [Anaerolineales bacterium]
MTEKTPILQVDNIKKAFGRMMAVNGVSFELFPGEILGIIGPNGSGKTTLINCITGFVKKDSGKVYFKGKDISKLAIHKIANRGLLRTFQVMRPYYSLPAYKNLIIPLYSPRSRRFSEGRLGDRDTVAVNLLEDVGFERDSFVPYKLASSLPTGYLKRIELARCLALRPEVLIGDEIFSGLSAAEISSLVPTIEKLQMQGITLVMIEHRLRALFRLADRVLVMNFGEKIAEGTPEQIMKDEQVREAYLGTDKLSWD